MTKVYIRKVLTTLIAAFTSISICYSQTTLTTPVPSGVFLPSYTDQGVIVFGLKNTNSTSITITSIANYLPANYQGNFALWYHPTAVAGAPSAITTANGWIQLVTSTAIVNTTAGVKSVLSGLNIVVPPNTIYRFALHASIEGPYYGGAGTTADVITEGGVELYAQGNPISPTYTGAFPGPLTNTPRSFYGSITFTTNPPPTANNAAVSSITSPVECAGNAEVRARIQNNGSNTINNVRINWEVDGVLQPHIDYTTPINVAGSTGGNEATVTLGNINFGVSKKNIRVWTSLPNGAADSDASDDEKTTSIRAKLSGTYTIGGPTPDFISFTEAIEALSVGICDAVTFNVEPNSGPYTEQITISAVTGASATKRITFRGNGNMIQFSPVADARFVVKLSGARYITLDSLHIVGTGTTYGYGILVRSGSHNDSIKNCIIDVSSVTSTTTANSAGIAVTGSNTSPTSAGDNASNLVIYNNEIVGGVRGITLYGNSDDANLYNNNNKVIGNIVRDFHLDGIVLGYQNNALVHGNDVHRMTRTSVGIFTGIEVATTSKGVTISANKVHDTHTSANAGTTTYGIRMASDAPAGSENKIVNNVIYNFNGSTGDQYGLYNTGSDSVWYYHNTVVLDNGSSTTGLARGFYQTSAATGIQLRNNIFYITRAGTGAKHGLYFGTTSSEILSNNNVFYVNAPAGTTGVGSFGTANAPTLTDWQAVNSSAYDQQSVSLDPMFVGGGDYTPTNSLMNGIGANVGVTTDIIGTTRSASPDPGAYEFSVAGLDADIAWIAPVMPVTAGLQTVTVKITNTQTTPITSLNMSYTDGITTQTQTFNGLNITANNSQQLSFTTQYNFAHTVRLRGYINSVNGVTDNNQLNDTTVYQNLCSPMSGLYTVNNNAALSATNFTSLTEVANALTCSGVSGPVIIDVVSGSGPYNEQISIGQITGTSATNNVRILGNGSTIQFSPTASARHIIQLDGADYITIDSFNILTTATAFGWGIHLLNGANFDSIRACTIDLSAVTDVAIDASGGIVMANSATDLNAVGNANNNTIVGNIIKAGYQGIIINGSATGTDAAGNIIRNNLIHDFYSTGIEIVDADGTIVEGNDIHRMNRSAGPAAATVVGTFGGVEVSGDSKNSLILKNRIHDTHTSVPSDDQNDASYGIYITGADAPVGSENKVINNVIYNFNSATGIQRGLYNAGSNGAFYYHNTIILDNAASTAGNTAAFYQTTAADNIQVRNNLFYVTRGGGTGTRHGVYFNTATSSIISNNNVFYISASAATVGIGSISTTNYASLTDWQAAAGNAYDQQSVAEDPMFIGGGDFTPTNPVINGIGANMGVTIDINGNPRSASPDPGAYEFSVAGLDADISWISPTSPAAPGMKTITVNITNTQTTPITAINISYTDGTTVQTQNFTGLNITAGNSQQLSFTSQYNLVNATSLRAYINNVNGVTDNSQINDTTALQNICVIMSGVYTVNNAMPTSGTNYQTLTEVVNSLACSGVSGPVVIYVEPNSGPYNEQLTIPAITGASATNRIRILGNGTTIQTPTTVSAQRQVIRLDGADYVTIDSFNLVTAGITYGWGVHFTNGANNDSVRACTIDISAVTSTTQSNSGGIIMSGSNTSVTTDGNANNNVIVGNIIKGGYQGVIITGATDALDAVGNVIRNNIIQDFYANGIELADADGTIVEFNDISRMTRTAVGTFAGVEMNGDTKNSLINANKIHDTHNAATTQSGTAYGIYSTANDVAVGSENKVTNNLIYNFNSATGIQYGLYNSSSNGIFYYHNTVVLDNASSASGTTRGFYQLTTATGIQIRNNIFYITRGGSGNKHGLYFGATGSSIISNNNVIYVNATGGTVGIGSFGTANQATLANWQAANGGAYDQQSVSIDPMFTSPGYDFVPTEPGINNIGGNVGVSTDITGATRSATSPDPGAYEFGAPLPVTLLNFRGEQSGSINKLIWSTATETNNKGFELERSADGRNFSSVTFVATKAENGNSTSTINYSYNDARPNAGDNYYRLKQIDRDGKFSYSNVVLLSRKVADITLSSVYPNPTDRELNLVITSPRSEKVMIIVADLTGKIVMQRSTQLMIGNNQETLNVQQLSSGTYIIKAVCTNGCETSIQRFVKQ